MAKIETNAVAIVDMGISNIKNMLKQEQEKTKLHQHVILKRKIYENILAILDDIKQANTQQLYWLRRLQELNIEIPIGYSEFIWEKNKNGL